MVMFTFSCKTPLIAILEPSVARKMLFEILEGQGDSQLIRISA